MEQVQAWSPTLLAIAEECMYRVKLAKVDKIPEPERPPLPNGQEYPNDRGSRIHDETEAFVKGQGKFTFEMRYFAEELAILQALYKDGVVITEQLWGFDEEWNYIPPIKEKQQWGKHWARIKIDAFVQPNPYFAIIIDHKTGKRFNNEVKHGDQMLCYAVAAFEKYPELQEVSVELWYFDANVLVQQTITRAFAAKLKKRIDYRGTRITSETQFIPTPSAHNCRFCPYKTGLIGKHGPEGTGHCNQNLKVTV